MGMKSHAATFGLGFLLAHPDTRSWLDHLRHQAVEQSRPRARALREYAWDTLGTDSPRRRTRGTRARHLVPAEPGLNHSGTRHRAEDLPTKHTGKTTASAPARVLLPLPAGEIPVVGRLLTVLRAL